MLRIHTLYLLLTRAMSVRIRPAFHHSVGLRFHGFDLPLLDPLGSSCQCPCVASSWRPPVLLHLELYETDKIRTLVQLGDKHCEKLGKLTECP